MALRHPGVDRGRRRGRNQPARLDLGDRLIQHLDNLSIGLVGPRTRASLAHLCSTFRPASGCYFVGEKVRVSPERDGIRVSFGLFNTVEDVDRLAEILRRRNH
jgi:hypothetical protein